MAAMTLPPCHIKTPLIKSEPLSKLHAPHNIYFKLDLQQPSGSFKIRGVGAKVRSIAETNLKNKNNPDPSSQFAGCVCSSGGNAGLACAKACAEYNLKCKIILPTTTPAFAVEKLKEMNPAVEVEIFGDVWNTANEKALKIVDAGIDGEQYAYVHPFQQPELWEGHSTIVDEIVEQLPENGKNLGAIVTVCGGGGLARGIIDGVQRHFGNKANGSYSSTKKIGVFIGETHGADSLYQALEKKEKVTLPGITSIAKSLGSLQAHSLYEYILEESSSYKNDAVQVCSYRISDKDALSGVLQFKADTGSLVEPACGAGTFLAYGGSKEDSSKFDIICVGKNGEVRKVANDNEKTALSKMLESALGSSDEAKDIVIEICGGSMISEELLDKWKTEFGL